MALDVDSQMEPGDTLTSSCPERTRPCKHSRILRWERERHRATETTPCRGTILAICERNGSLGSLCRTPHNSVTGQRRPDSPFSRLFSHHLQDV